MEVMVTRRFFSFFLAGVIIASTIFPASAWGKDSFISGGEEYESSVDVSLSDDLPIPDVYAAPHRAPRMFKVSAADQAAAEVNTSGKLVVPATLPTSVDGTFQAMSKHYYKNSDPPVKVEFDYWNTVISTFSCSPFFSPYNGRIYFLDGDVQYSPSVFDPDDMTYGIALFCNKSSGVVPPGYGITGSGGGNVGRNSWSFVINYDVSSYASSAFSLDGYFSFFTELTVLPSYVYFSSVDVLVDGQQVLSLSRGNSTNIDLGGYVYSGSSNISTISFRLVFPFAISLDKSLSAGSYYCSLACGTLTDDPKALTISFLDGQDFINAQNDKTKDDINKHEELESQWVGSMTENFNKLDIGNFTFHSGLIAGFAMVSGIFMDLWRGMGNAAVVYVFPLTLGVVLVLLGRISRFGGKRGTEEGDDSS